MTKQGYQSIIYALITVIVILVAAIIVICHVLPPEPEIKIQISDCESDLNKLKIGMMRCIQERDELDCIWRDYAEAYHQLDSLFDDCIENYELCIMGSN